MTRPPTRAAMALPGAMRLLTVVAALLLATAPPMLAQDAGADPAASTPIAAEADPGQDLRIQRRLSGILEELGTFDRVRVADGVVHLSGEVPDNAALARLREIAGRVEGVVAVENDASVSTDLERRLDPALTRLRQRAWALVQSAPLLIVALLAGGATALGGGWLAGRLPLWRRLAPNAFVAEVIRTLARLAFVLLGVMVALEILDATALLGAVLGAAGVAGLALGFAVRDTVENFIASLMLSLRQPFRPNDYVEIEGSAGRVARLTSRATILISPEGNHIRIPNAAVFKGRIVNYTRDPQRRFTFTLGVDADADLGAALATGVEAIKALPFVLTDPPVSAWVEDVGDSNVLLTFTGWVDQTRTDFAKARGEAVRAAKVALEGAGFGLPEPIYRVRLDAWGGAGAAAPNVIGRPAAGAEAAADAGSEPAAPAPTRAAPSPAPSPAPAPATGPAANAEAAPPPESDPTSSADPTVEAVARERRATDAGEDLLGAQGRSE